MVVQLQTRSSRRRAIEREASEPDRLSELPEELIVRILSLLEMKDAVKTGILSKRWKNLWKQVDSLVYICHEMIPDMRGLSIHEIEIRWHQLTSFVDKTLREYTREKLKKFYFSDRGMHFLFDREILESGRVDAWIKCVLKKNVEHLKLEFEPRMHQFTVPDCVFQSSSLKKLELEDVTLSVTSPVVNMTSLQGLGLRRLVLHDAFMNNILMGCPMLETMHLYSVDGLHSINIRSRSMKKLELVEFTSASDYVFIRMLLRVLSGVSVDHDDNVLEIIAPSLRELVILDEFLVDKFKLLDVSSLEKATLKFYNKSLSTEDNHLWINMTTEILKSVSVVDELILGSQLIQILTLSKLTKKPSPLFNCKHLAIESYFWKFDLPGIAYLLENAPHLETLSIDVLDWQQADNPSQQTCELFLNKDPHLNMPAGNYPNLMKVTIDFFRCSSNNERSRGNEEYIECFDFDMLEYILKSAVVLEKLVLCSSRSRCEDISRCQLQDNCSFQSVPRLSSQLQAAFLFHNRAVEWELKKKTNKYEFSFSK